MKKASQTPGGLERTPGSLSLRRTRDGRSADLAASFILISPSATAQEQTGDRVCLRGRACSGVEVPLTGQFGGSSRTNPAEHEPTAVASGSDGFGWNNTGIGAGFLLGAVLLGLASLRRTGGTIGRSLTRRSECHHRRGRCRRPLRVDGLPSALP